mgnify:CR=1 FL=1
MEAFGLTECADDLNGKKRLFTSLWWERHAPLLSMAVLFALMLFTMRYWEKYCLEKVDATTIGKLFDGALGLASIMAGFSSTLIGIVFSIRGSIKLKKLEQSGHFNILKEYLKVTVYWNMFLALFCIGANVAITRADFLISASILGVVPIFIASIVSVLRIVRVMANLL